MKNRLNKQLTLPLDVMQSDLSQKYLDIVKQSWQITFSKQHLTSVYAKRVMGLIASQIQEGEKVKEYYQISANMIINETNLQKAEVYKRMKSVTYELSTITFYFEDEKTGQIIPRHLLDTTRFMNPAGYYNGVLTIAFNPQLKGIIDSLSHFSNYELKRYMNFSSWYSMRLYEILTAFRDLQDFRFKIDQYRDWMGCGAKINPKTGEKVINNKTGKFKYEKYSSHSDAIKYTTLEPLKDFKDSWLAFSVKPVFAEGTGRGRRPIEYVKFTFIQKRNNPKEIIKKWCENSEKFNSCYLRLKKYQVSDRLIIRYSPILGHDWLGKKLVEWDQKMKSRFPILNKAVYCNKVIRESGEKALEDKCSS